MSSAITLKASYTAPSSEAKSFKQSLPACSTNPSTAERTSSLTALRTALGEAQDQINVFLTQKMDEDNTKAGAAQVDDAKFEETYGEEAAEED